MAKHRVSITDHGVFNLFGMNVSLPAIIELEDDQIQTIKNSGLYHISELDSSQKMQAKPTPLSEIEGDRFDRARTLSVNELAFKNPIMGTAFKNKAQNGVIVKKGSFLINRALKKEDTVKTVKSTHARKEQPLNKVINNNPNDSVKVKKDDKEVSLTKDNTSSNNTQLNH